MEQAPRDARWIGARPTLRAAMIFAAAGIIGCGKEPPKPAASTSASSAIPADGVNAAATPTPASILAPAVEYAALQDYAATSPIKVSEVAHSAQAIHFSLELDAEWATPDIQNGLILVVPTEGELRVEALTAARVEGGSGREIAPAPGLKDSFRIERLGVMRHWPLAAIHWDGAKVDAARRANSDAPLDGLRARLAVTWDRELTPPAAPPHPEELAPESPWRRVAEALVANPEGLSLYQLPEAPVHSEIKIEPTDPSLKMSARPWARLRLSAPGFYRLDLAALERAGVAGARERPDQVTVLRRGRAVPLARVRRPGGAEELYLWNEPNPSPFTKESAYWITLASADGRSAEGAADGAGDLHPARLEAAADAPADLAGVPSTLVTSTVARRDQNNELLISYGEFRDVRAMRWGEAELVEDAPRDFEIELPGWNGYLPLKAAVNFYFLLGQQRKSPVPTDGLRVEVATDDGLTTEFTFETDLDARRELLIKPEAVRDGRVHLRMRLAGAQNGLPDGIDAVWLDWIEVPYTAWAGAIAATEARLTLADPPTSGAESASPMRSPWRLTRTRLSDAPTTRGLLAVSLGPEGRVEAPRLINESGGAGEDVQILWRGGAGWRTEIIRADDAPTASAFEEIRRENLIAPAQGADFLIVSHADFIEGLRPLAEFHQSAGRRVRIVDTQSVYDNFSHGEPTPFAIRDFLAHALDRWEQGAPTHVLLVGDCSSDYRDYAGMGVKNYTPTYAFESGGDQWASDEWMAMVAGDDPLPDFILGRISVNNPKDLANVIEKTLFHAERAPFGPWRARLAHVSDNEPVFPAALERLARERRPAGFEVSPLRLNEAPMVDNFYSSDASRRATFEREGRWMKTSVEATARLLRMFKAGASSLTFFGHGSPNIWTTERIWFGGDSVNSDNLQLTDAIQAPVVINLTCNSGAIDYPIPRWNINIIEDMLRVKDGGAAAAWVPSGPGQTDMQEQLARVLYDAWFDPGLPSLGEKVLASKIRYAGTRYPDEFRNGYTIDYVRMYILLGDPTLRTELPNRMAVFKTPREIYAPGDLAQVTLGGLKPERGQYEARLLDARGEPIWSSEAKDYTGGVIAAVAPIPDDAAPGPVTFSVYAWDEIGREDTLAWAQARIGFNEDRLTTATLLTQKDAQADAGPTLSAEVFNAGDLTSRGGRIEARWVAPAAEAGVFTSGTLATADIRLDPGEHKTVTLRIGDDAIMREGGRFLEARLIPGSAATTATGASENAIRLAWPGNPDPPPIAPMLRIAPGSARIKPESPSEGETIFVSVDVENFGSGVSAQAIARLFDADPSQTTNTAYNHNLQEEGKPNTIEIPPLAPGARRTLTFRWDPSFNAGEQNWWARVDPGGDDVIRAQAAGLPLHTEERLATGAIRVRSKAKLSYRLKPVTEVDRSRMAALIEAEIVNDGETEARNVSVAFFRGAKPDPANKVFETTLDVVPAGGSVPVRTEWSFGTMSVYREGLGIQVWMKGSSLRMISAHENLQ